MKIVVLIIAALLAAADQIIKYFISASLTPDRAIAVMDKLFYITYLENRGAAFGFFENMNVGPFLALTTMTGCILLILFLFKYKEHSRLSYVAVALTLSGGVGNLIDRIRLGYVVDYMHFSFFGYVFNLADCLITLGAVLIIVALLFSPKNKRTKNGKTVTGINVLGESLEAVE